MRRRQSGGRAAALQGGCAAGFVVAGRARAVDDRSKIRELYRPDWPRDSATEAASRTDDPRMTLIAVDVEVAHLMELNKAQPVVLFEVAKGW